MIRKTQGLRIGTLAAIGLLALAAARPTPDQEAKPAKTNGNSVKEASTMPLGGQIPALEGYALRIRTIVLQPGGQSAHHSHAKRPVVAYLVSGNYTEHRDGAGLVDYLPGEQWVESAAVAHWSENRGSEASYLINFEVIAAK